MPIAVKLSRKFYDAFGDEVVNELVEVLNQVDFAYRGTLHDLNEANFGRFDEKLARFGGELRAEMQAGFAKVDARLADLRAEMQVGFARVDARLDQEIAGVRAEMQAGFAKADARLDQEIASVRAEMQAGFGRAEQQIAGLRTDMMAMRGELVKWMFLFWAGTALTVIGLIKF